MRKTGLRTNLNQLATTIIIALSASITTIMMTKKKKKWDIIFWGGRATFFFDYEIFTVFMENELMKETKKNNT